MKNINNKYMAIIAMLFVVIFLYWGSGTMMNDNINGFFGEDGLPGINYRSWSATVAVIAFGAFAGWLYFYKKKKY